MKDTLMAILCAIFAFMCSINILESIVDIKCVMDMNAQEKHYDVDGMFILVDKDHDLVGLYNGTESIDHTKIDADKFEIGSQEIPIVVYGR